MKYGYIGLGNLGGHLAYNLVKAGFPMVVTDLNRDNAERHLAAGAKWAATPQALASEVDCVITCLPSPKVSRFVLDQILPVMKPGATWIEMSTLGRSDICALAEHAAHHGIKTLACPVTGGVHLAAQGKITVLVGGDQELFDKHKAAPASYGRPDFPSRQNWQRGGGQSHHQHAGLYPFIIVRRGINAGETRRG